MAADANRLPKADAPDPPPKRRHFVHRDERRTQPLHRDEDVDALFAAADTALHVAKANGRDRKEVAVA